MRTGQCCFICVVNTRAQTCSQAHMKIENCSRKATYRLFDTSRHSDLYFVIKPFTHSTEIERQDGGEKKKEPKKAKPASFKTHKKHAGPCLQAHSPQSHITLIGQILPLPISCFCMILSWIKQHYL